jgi:hypothetical protein
MKTWLKKEVEPLPTIPELPEVVTPYQAAKEHSIDAALQAERVIAPNITMPASESKPETNGSNLAKVAIFQQMVEQTGAKETEKISFPLPQQGVHDWEEKTPNTHIENKSGNTKLKTSRGNTNYSWGTDLLFYPIKYILRQMVDDMQPRPPSYEDQVAGENYRREQYELRKARYPERYAETFTQEGNQASHDYYIAQSAYNTRDGRNSPGRTRYNKAIEAAERLIAVAKEDPRSIAKNEAQKAHKFLAEEAEHQLERQLEYLVGETNDFKKEIKKIAKQKNSSSSKSTSSTGSSSGKGPNRDRNPQDDASKLAGLAEKQATRPQKVGNINELFKQEGFGKKLKQNVEKIEGVNFQKQQAYKITKDMPEYGIKKGDKLYLDGLHKDHLEVFKEGSRPGQPPRTVLSIDGRILAEKLAKAIAEGRKCPF